MKQKIFQLFVTLSFFIVFWYVYGDEFWQYQDIKKQEQNYQVSVTQQKNEFTTQSILDLADAQLFVTPDIWLLENIVSEIDAAENRVFVEVYIFTERDMRDALIRAHKRWVEVKILLENNPYKAPYLNDSHYNDLKDAGVDVVWSDPLNYSLNHSKLLIIDDSAYISTGNFSYSLFKTNTDFLVKISDSELLKVLTQLFIWDFNHSNIWAYHDNEFEQVLFTVASRGIKIRWIVSRDFYVENPDIIQLYSENSIDLRPINTWKLHAKSIIVDWKIAYIGSINFSTYSFDENREIWIILNTPGVIEKLRKTFYSDL